MTSQSAWCNMVVLVRKKDGGLHFCIEFCCLNAHTTGGIRKSGRCWTFFKPRPQVRVLANKYGGSIETVYHLHSRQFVFFKCNHMPFRLCNAPATFQQLMQNCLGELNLIYCLIYIYNIDSQRASPPAVCNL